MKRGNHSYLLGRPFTQQVKRNPNLKLMAYKRAVLTAQDKPIEVYWEDNYFLYISEGIKIKGIKEVGNSSPNK